MHFPTSIRAVCCLFPLLLAPLTAAAADVLQNVPKDALGFVVIKRLGATDAKANELLKTFRSEFLGPLAFLQAVTGAQDGLDTGGDLLIAVLPANQPNGSPRFAIWLPVNEYDRLLKSLNAMPGEAVTAASVANEDVLIAKHGNWALVMDPDQRVEMERIITAAPEAPPSIAAWNDWLEAQDVAAVVLRGGIQYALDMSGDFSSPGRPPSAGEGGPDEQVADSGLFGPSDLPDNSPGLLLTAFRKLMADVPELKQWVKNYAATGLALRIDSDGNALASSRVSFIDGYAPVADARPQVPQQPASLHDGGGFVVHGAGRLYGHFQVVVGWMFARSLLEDLKNEEGIEASGKANIEFQRALHRAAGSIRNFEVLSRTGDGATGVYTNQFLVVHTEDVKAFTGYAAAAMRIWNEINREGKSETPLVFEVEEVKVGERPATQYSLDIAAADGAPPIPEIRQAMEKFFGPGGKFRLWIVPVDEHTVLLASATPDEVAAALSVLDKKLPADSNHEEVRAAGALLPEQADWRLFVSPHQYFAWLRRYTEAMTGENVIGGPLVKDFPASPPIAVVGIIRDGELQIDAVAPVETIKAAGEYRNK